MPPNNNFSDMCLMELSTECEKERKKTTNNTLTDGNEKVYVSRSFWMMGRTPSRGSTNSQQAPENMHAPATSLMNEQRRENAADEDDALAVRDFFPEVWLFDDYKLNETGGLELKLTSPHSVTEWSLVANFWAPGKQIFTQSAKSTVT